MAPSLSHGSFHTRPDARCHHTSTQSIRDKNGATRAVHFAASTIDVCSALAQRQPLCFSPCPKPEPILHCKPILKNSEGSMAQYLRRAGETFGRALHALGIWCMGVTSKNPNVRCDMYKQLIAHIRGDSTQMQKAAETVLQDHVHGFWFSLVDDFGMLREEYSQRDVILSENAAQLMGIILSNHKCLEKLNVHDVQTFILEVLSRVEGHFDRIMSLGDRLQAYIWLLSCEIPKWWTGSNEFYSQSLCRRLYDVVLRADLRTASPSVQRSLLDIFRIVYVRYPKLKTIEVDYILCSGWDFMWSEDEHVKRAARNVAKLIADQRGGELGIFQVIKTRYRTPNVFKWSLCVKIEKEYHKSAADALELWLIITRLLKQNILSVAQDQLEFWLQIAQDSLLDLEHGAMAGIGMHYITHYSQSFIPKNKKFLAAFMSAFRPNVHYPSYPLEALDKCLAGFHFENPLTEPAPEDRDRERPDLKVWATLTVAAMKNNHPSEQPEKQVDHEKEKKQYYELVGSIYCHWDNLLRAMTAATEYDGFDDDAKTQELIDVCEILKAPAFSQYIQDAGNVLPKTSKHAVNTFWFNLMASILSRDAKNTDQIFPVEILRSIFPMVTGGLSSTQRRIRQSTYRFVLSGPVLGGLRWLREQESIDLLRAIEETRESYEADIYASVKHVDQILDCGVFKRDARVEARKNHPLSLTPVVPLGRVGAIKWVWYDENHVAYPLGMEEVFSEQEKADVIKMELDRRERETERRYRKAGKDRVLKEKIALKTSARAANKDNSPRQKNGILPVQRDQEKVCHDQTKPTYQATREDYYPPSVSSPTPATKQVDPLQAQTPIKSQTSASGSQVLEETPQPSPLTYDKRMPPPPVDWRTNSSSQGKHSTHAVNTSQPNASSSSSRKRPNHEPETSPSKKKRLLESDYVPAQHTSWKPDWLDSTQCYPVNQKGQELSDVEDIMGDAIYRNADRMKQVLEDECIYIPTHRVDELLAIAQDTCEALKRTKQFMDNYPAGPIRIVRNQYL